MPRIPALTGVAVGCLLLVSSLVAGPAVEPADAWDGKTRHDLLATLGQPDKIKQQTAGSELFVYRFVRVEEGGYPDVDMELLNVPGVGQVARMIGRDAPGANDVVAIGPTELDRDGTMRGASREIRLGQGPGSKDATLTSRAARIVGKLKLVFRLDEDGNILSWKATPRKL